MALRKFHNTWYVYFRDVDGTQRTRSLKTTDRATAEALHRKFMLMLQAKKGELALMRCFPERFSAQLQIQTVVPETDDPGEHQRGSIALAAMWDLALTRRQLSRTHAIYWRRFLAKIGVKFADQVTPALALRFLEENYSSGNGKSFNNAKSALNTVFRCCLVEAGLATSPFAPIVNKRVVDIEHHRNLTLEEVARIMAADIPTHAKIMTMLSRWTAQRLETCARMTPDMFDFESKVFIIDPGKNKRFKEWVCCPIMPELENFIRPLLEECADPAMPIVQNFGYPAKNDYFSMDFRGYLAKLGINDTELEKASFHSLRGTAITWFRENGFAGDDLKLITGHDSQRVEDIYARPVKRISQLAKQWHGSM